MLKVPVQIALAFAIICLLQACSWFGDKPPEYVESRDGEPVRVPDDLDEPLYRSPISIAHPELRMPSGDELNPGPPRVVATAGSSDSNAVMAWSAEGVYLLVMDSPESTIRRLGFAIERSGMKMLDKSPEGRHRFEFYQQVYDERSMWQKMAFWRRDTTPNYTGIYRTRVEPDGENTRVYLQFDSGDSATTDAAEHVLGIFMERLG